MWNQQSVAIRSTRHLGMFPHRYTDDWLLVGQDGGQSIRLNGQTLFVFSDTLLAWRRNAHQGKEGKAPYEIPLGERGIFLANSAGLASGTDLRQTLAVMRYYTDEEEMPREILVPTAEERAIQIRFWPEHGIYLDGQVYLYYLGIQQMDSKSNWDFKNLGAGLAVLDPETGNCQRIYRDGNWCLWPAAADDFHFGVQVLHSGEDVYIFGSTRQSIQFQTILARVKASRIAEPAAYEYLCSVQPMEWCQDRHAACDLGEASSDYSVAYNRYLQKYVMFYVEGHTRWLKLRAADQLTGPYSLPQKIAKVPAKASSELLYLAFEHPAFCTNQGEKVFISYCQPHFSPNELIEIRFR